jgi:hypothetical protein
MVNENIKKQDPIEGKGDFRGLGCGLGIMIITKVESKYLLTLKNEVHSLLGSRHNETVSEFKLSRA